MTELPQILLQFLQEEEEYRREIQLEKETITENEKELCVWGIFQTPRLDKKELKICFDREAQSFRDRAGRAVVAAIKLPDVVLLCNVVLKCM